ncbi:MAG: hypothetical protein KDC83_07305 [Flavobacteriales bacterium]|nr:hypothetical protein [Flavobacteriales bacterium]
MREKLERAITNLTIPNPLLLDDRLWYQQYSDGTFIKGFHPNQVSLEDRLSILVGFYSYGPIPSIYGQPEFPNPFKKPDLVEIGINGNENFMFYQHHITGICEAGHNGINQNLNMAFNKTVKDYTKWAMQLLPITNGINTPIYLLHFIQLFGTPNQENKLEQLQNKYSEFATECQIIVTNYRTAPVVKNGTTLNYEIYLIGPMSGNGTLLNVTSYFNNAPNEVLKQRRNISIFNANEKEGKFLDNYFNLNN